MFHSLSSITVPVENIDYEQFSKQYLPSQGKHLEQLNHSSYGKQKNLHTVTVIISADSC
jgi:hypothetical protein